MLSYKYYDSPEGQDIFKKTFVTSKYAAITGLTAASFDVLMYSHPKGFVNTIGRYAWFIGPMVGMAAAFTVTTNVAQNIRGKNDKINYFLGGVAAGSVFGAWQRNATVAVPLSVLLGVAAVIKKTGVDEGWTFFPEISHATKTIQSVRHDWTLVKDLEEYKNFTTGPN
ncbi:NADH dehydrogenase [ubiquinone] 1 alpha subcomplex subunit 11 [Plodia interpunctella]|uniref:NADH dehydrogenase [ubiquinone] 1 alpha subcomplex subunit 11 n=1 Tax=Plodia interpunctella TaxID=58824 RepID=UPI002367E14C|nr:NADH dehydrogenase [ubiquinone] 1 alpha subcomplex subunit 11 [Plodia interpunctella]